MSISIEYYGHTGWQRIVPQYLRTVDLTRMNRRRTLTHITDLAPALLQLTDGRSAEPAHVLRRRTRRGTRRRVRSRSRAAGRACRALRKPGHRRGPFRMHEQRCIRKWFLAHDA